MSSYKYFDELFEKLVELHEQLDTASMKEKNIIIDELRNVQTQGDDIYKQWLILQEYIDILDQEYNLSMKQEKAAETEYKTNKEVAPNGDTSNLKIDTKENELPDNEQKTKQIFWVADEEAVTTFRKGIGYFELLMFENSIEYFKETVNNDPNFMMARVYLGLCYLSLGKFNEAEEELKKSLLFAEEGNPYITLANHALGCVYAQLKKYELAQQYFQEVIHIDENFKNIYFNLGASYYNQQNYAKAKSIFLKGIKLNPKDWELYFLLGKCNMFLMDFNQAIKNLKIAFQLSNRIEVGLTLGKAYEITNQTSMASGVYENLLELFPKEAELYHRMGWIHLYNNEHNKAVIAIKRAIVLDRKNESYLFSLGWVYLHANKKTQANICFKQIEKCNIKNIYSKIGFAKLANESDSYNNAKEYLLKAIKDTYTKHELGVLAYHLGYYWLQRKNYNKSLNSFKASLRIAPYLTESNFYIQVLDKITNKEKQPIT
ncbi:tetratricopeptide repeat protein [Desulfuribacillus alkaliarsenatis]|uniref:Uncharacterized protein n=1 Tax=Desulfuribacillus alkaliarsenatis TaxID=766136 RepID=A0A1E5FZI9_9FIRM|nr:tetratricopeptide repeat protein [Desulfuribacillus alkaliarsenatis]OEF95982.1 hypothetical protein BHF68_09525 [Desulfuribacillus alkaliarsenatis]